MLRKLLSKTDAQRKLIGTLAKHCEYYNQDEYVGPNIKAQTKGLEG